MRKIYRFLIPLALLCIMITCIPTFSTSKADWKESMEQLLKNYSEGKFEEEEEEEEEREKEEEKERWAEAAKEYNEYTVENGYPEGMHDWYNRYHLADWTDEDWAMAKLVTTTGNYIDAETGYSYFYGVDMRREFAELKSNNYFILRVCVPYDSCGNMIQDCLVTHQITVPKDGETYYLDNVLKKDDKDESYVFMESAFTDMTPFDSRDTYKHVKITSDLVVITRYQIKDDKYYQEDTYNDAVMKKKKTAYAGESRLPSDTNVLYSGDINDYIKENIAPNLWFAFSDYINPARYAYKYECRNIRDLPHSPKIKVYHKLRKLSKKPSQVYTMSEVKKKADAYAAKYPESKRFFDWSITPFELYFYECT